ncbi:MAG: hypothetical protein RQ967_03165 [Candidatus Caldipriscus sp.]|nr:hypothetical protein [Candidatus Caldipriscus sp.]
MRKRGERKGITFALMPEDIKASIYDFAILELMKVKNLEIVDRKDIDKVLSEQEVLIMRRE